MNDTLTIPPPRPLDIEVLTGLQVADLAGVKLTAVGVWRHRHTPEAYAAAETLYAAAVESGEHDEDELAEQLAELRRKTPFPEPDDQVGAIPVWRLERVTAWLEITGRKYDEAAWRTKRDRGDYRRATNTGISEINRTRQRAAATPKKRTRTKK